MKIVVGSGCEELLCSNCGAFQDPLKQGLCFAKIRNGKYTVYRKLLMCESQFLGIELQARCLTRAIKRCVGFWAKNEPPKEDDHFADNYSLTIKMGVGASKSSYFVPALFDFL